LKNFGFVNRLELLDQIILSDGDLIMQRIVIKLLTEEWLSIRELIRLKKEWH